MATKSLAFASLFIPLLILPIAIAHSHDHENSVSPFEFIKQLEGRKKGDHTKGIHDLKLYLHHFGYLNGDFTHVDDDEFDSLLESAIKMYQLNYHLKPTGTLDSRTVAQMMMPRCGVPDIVDGMNWMGYETKDRDGHGQGLSFDRRPKWPASKSHLTYAFLPNTPEAAMHPIERAFKAWSSVTHFTFSQVSDTAKSDIQIGFNRGNHGDGKSFDGKGGVLAHAFAPTSGVLHYDADEAWSVGDVPDAFDLETVALHEIGHLLGLGHSSIPGAIMYPNITPGTSKGLHAEDVKGIKALYNF
ncbi:hypothetical protein MLD38_012572 [Melastoma candidum]|uniref:Uncharacterized protein n=1 Tax=Melastoma candidum TaxID=119954 RepID=A0ACB9R6C0_9MYRT|nr:hypothetical protein MLD38_012572 [Melastoma candidum]